MPLSDFGHQGAEVRYTAWVCANPACAACGFNLKIRNGEVIRDEPVTDAAAGGERRGAGGGPRPTGLTLLPGTVRRWKRDTSAPTWKLLLPVTG